MSKHNRDKRRQNALRKQSVPTRGRIVYTARIRMTDGDVGPESKLHERDITLHVFGERAYRSKERITELAMKAYLRFLGDRFQGVYHEYPDEEGTVAMVTSQKDTDVGPQQFALYLEDLDNLPEAVRKMIAEGQMSRKDLDRIASEQN